LYTLCHDRAFALSFGNRRLLVFGNLRPDNDRFLSEEYVAPLAFLEFSIGANSGKKSKDQKGKELRRWPLADYNQQITGSLIGSTKLAAAPSFT
jgi:hypothetical protein